MEQHTPSPNAQQSKLPSVHQQHGGKSIIWVNGLPEPAYTQPLSQQALKQLHYTALSLPYEGVVTTNEETGLTQTLIEERFKDCTNAEVIVRKQVEKATTGDDNATQQVLDRTIGKPKQQLETLNVNLTLQDFLQTLVEDSTEASVASSHILDGL